MFLHDSPPTSNDDEAANCVDTCHSHELHGGHTDCANRAQTVSLHSTMLSTSLIQHAQAVPLSLHLRRLMRGMVLLGCYAMHVIGLAAATCKVAYRYFLLHSLGNSFIGRGGICSWKGYLLPCKPPDSNEASLAPLWAQICNYEVADSILSLGTAVRK